MSEVFRIPSDRQPFLDPQTGLISRPWFLFLQGIFVRIGGATGSSTDEGDVTPSSGTSDIEGVFLQAFQSLNVAPVLQIQQQIDSIESTLSSNNAELAELRRYVDGLSAGTII